jgi:hypothetical protein
MGAEMKKAGTAYGRFDIKTIAESFPPKADTLLLDTYLTNEQAASSRVFRVYRPTPAHYHATCDEYLYVSQAGALSGLSLRITSASSNQASFFFSERASFTLCRICTKSRSFSFPSIRRGAIRRTSSSSIPKTERLRALSGRCDVNQGHVRVIRQSHAALTPNRNSLQWDSLS